MFLTYNISLLYSDYGNIATEKATMQDYNCTGSIDSSYGASAYGTCATQVGVPNTGPFQSFYTSPWLDVALPVIGIVIITATSILIAKWRRKRRTDDSTDASL